MASEDVSWPTSRIRHQLCWTRLCDKTPPAGYLHLYRLGLCGWWSSLGQILDSQNYFGVTVRCPDAKRPSSAGLVIVQRTSRPIGPAVPKVITGL